MRCHKLSLLALPALFTLVGLTLVLSATRPSLAATTQHAPSPAFTSLGPTLTPTPGCCSDVTGTISSSCDPTPYHYTYSLTNNCNRVVRASGALYFEVSPNETGPWTSPIHGDFFNTPIDPGYTEHSGAMWFGPLPVGNNWFRMRLNLVGTCFVINTVSTPLPACILATATPLISNTPTTTRSPTDTRTSTLTHSPTSTRTGSPQPPTATPICQTTWSAIYSPNSGSVVNLFNDVAAVSANDIWAVGYYQAANNDPYQTLTEHWDGVQWTVVPSANVGPGRHQLRGVVAISANDVWAVGYYVYSSNYQTLVEHWNGAQWSIVPSPNPGKGFMSLNGITAISVDDVWAIGSYGGSSYGRTLIIHWDGTQWNVVPSPNVGTNGNYLNRVTAIAPDNIWAVGFYYASGIDSQTLVEHWDGSAWSVVPSPNLGGFANELRDVAVVSESDIWAVGYYSNSNGGGFQPMITHWNGSEWSLAATPNLPTTWNFLQGVAALSSNDVWAVGSYGPLSTSQTLTLHWDGNEWSIVSSQSPGTLINSLYGVTAISTDHLWTVGQYAISGVPGSRTLVEEYHDQCPISTPTPTCSMTFPDVQPADYFYAAVRYLYCQGAISGYSDNTFRPYNNATRAQLCKIVVLAEGWDVDCPDTGHFSDVPPGHAFYCYVETAYEHDVISGYDDGTFRPDNYIARGQLCKIIVLAQQWPIETDGGPHFTDVPPTNQFYTFIETAYNRSIISGYLDGTFRPGNSAARGQICKIVYEAITQPH